jgi:hypothetical protein
MLDGLIGRQHDEADRRAMGDPAIEGEGHVGQADHLAGGNLPQRGFIHGEQPRIAIVIALYVKD